MTPTNPSATNTTRSRVIARSLIGTGGGDGPGCAGQRTGGDHDVGLRSGRGDREEVQVTGCGIDLREPGESAGLAGEVDSAHGVEIRREFVGERSIAVRQDRATEHNDVAGDDVGATVARSGGAVDAESLSDSVGVHPTPPVRDAATGAHVDAVDHTVAVGIGPDAEQPPGQPSREATGDGQAGNGVVASTSRSSEGKSEGLIGVAMRSSSA